MGVKPDLDALPCLPPEQFEEAKWNAIRAYGYANRFLFKMLPLVSNPNMGFALFNPKGVLLKLYGAKTSSPGAAPMALPAIPSGEWRPSAPMR